MMNIIIIIITILTLIGMFYDERITKKRLIIIISLVIILGILGFYLNKLPYELIKDLFWYSVLMMLSFVFHVLWLKWLHDYFYNKDYNYICYIISRISVIFSISGLLYLITNIRKLMYEGRTRYRWKRDGDKFTSSIVLKEHIIKKTEETYEKYYTKRGANLLIFYGYLTVEYKIFSIINSIITFLLIVVQLCLGYFVNNFNNYSIFILGIKLDKEKKDWKYYLKTSLIFISYFIITLLGAYLLGIPSRLYFIWMIMFVWATLKCLYYFSKRRESFLELLKYIFLVIFKGEWFSFEKKLNTNQIENYKGFDLIYGSWMHYNLEYFLFSYHTSLNLWTAWEVFETSDTTLFWDGDHLGNMMRLPYPMVSYFKYYTNFELAQGEYEAATTYNPEYLWEHPRFWPYDWWCCLIDICIKFYIYEEEYIYIYKNFPENLDTDKMLLMLAKPENFKWIEEEKKFIYIC